ncbi:ankyrin repeat-containing protein [Niemeyer virus]|uniref:Ankyrin repeat-containing protein n=1 Tax=Acanthamoeba polyphaga mimivirus Kroon TaxID=3069720 RepID=A0A0G2Y2D4_9VIRU|nr:ankyrin repeat-containing protein [Acanthamoeba polyphaga mimivirus]AKI79920.1 ankyrin repeat-containing protein [Acanthamoeba polyphaga mimivirus Kroon]ALR83752.1 ankyrin repeat-containing protein [Niemeyer virus]
MEIYTDQKYTKLVNDLYYQNSHEIFHSSKIYQLALTNPEILTQYINYPYGYHESHELRDSISYNIFRFMAIYYKIIVIDNNMDLLSTIMSDDFGYDDCVILDLAIKHQRIDVFNKYKILGLDFNRSINCSTIIDEIILWYHQIKKYDIGIELCDYLLDNGTSISIRNYCTIINAFNTLNDKYISFFLNKIPLDDLGNLLFWYLRNGYDVNIDIVETILSNGIDINNFHEHSYTLIGNFNVPMMNLFLRYGLIIHDNVIDDACKYSNHLLVDYLMEMGHKPSKQIITNIIENHNISIIKLLVKYNIDLSDIKPPISPEISELVKSLESNGLSIEYIYGYVLDKFNLSGKLCI